MLCSWTSAQGVPVFLLSVGKIWFGHAKLWFCIWSDPILQILCTKPECIAIHFFEQVAFAHLGFLLFLLGAVVVLPDDYYLRYVVGSLCNCTVLKEEIFIVGYFRQWFHGRSIQHVCSWKERYSHVFLLLYSIFCSLSSAHTCICEVAGRADLRKLCGRMSVHQKYIVYYDSLHDGTADQNGDCPWWWYRFLLDFFRAVAIGEIVAGDCSGVQLLVLFGV